MKGRTACMSLSPHLVYHVKKRSSRTAVYLAVNPRDLVPSLAIENPIDGSTNIITESTIVVTYLADAFPDVSFPLLPPSNAPGGALTRARINFFVDTYFSKASALLHRTQRAADPHEAQLLAIQYVGVVEKELEPLLADARPFFGGSDHLTLAEALTGPFMIRLFAYAKHGLVPSRSLLDLRERAPNFERWAKVAKHPSVAGIFDEENIVARTKIMLAKQCAST